MAALLIPLYARADLYRTQTISLAAGWNAVFLEVDPVESSPGAVFSNTPIDMASSYYAPTAPAQFMADPTAELLRQTGWGTWYASSRPDAFLGDLYEIQGPRAYLLHATEAFTWQVTGEVRALGVDWRPDAYNLVGFTVSDPGSPTFAQFFAGSSAHAGHAIYRMADGRWRRVLDPAGETLRSGEAFWVYCDGGSTYQGPLSVKLDGLQGLTVGSVPGAVVLRNTTAHPISSVIESVVSGDAALPLSIVIQVVGDPLAPVKSSDVPMPVGGWSQDLPPLEAHGIIGIPLAARVEAMSTETMTGLLKLTTDMGTETWIPVYAFRDRLEDK